MKIKIGNTVYLQLMDIIFLDAHGLVPTRLEFFATCKKVLPNAEEKGHGFGYSFSDPEVVKWIMEQWYIIDYDELVGVDNGLVVVAYRVMEAMQNEAWEQYNLDPEEFEMDEEEAMLLKNESEYQLCQLGSLIEYNLDKLDIEFPPEYRPFADSPAFS